MTYIPLVPALLNHHKTPNPTYAKRLSSIPPSSALPPLPSLSSDLLPLSNYPPQNFRIFLKLPYDRLYPRKQIPARGRPRLQQ